MASDCDSGQRRSRQNRGVHGNEAFHASGLQHLGIGLEKLLIVEAAYGEKEKIVFAQVLLDAANDHGAVGITDFFRDNSDRMRPFSPQRPRKIIWSVVKFARGFEEAIFCMFGNRLRRTRLIEDRGNSAGS